MGVRPCDSVSRMTAPDPPAMASVPPRLVAPATPNSGRLIGPLAGRATSKEIARRVRCETGPRSITWAADAVDLDVADIRAGDARPLGARRQVDGEFLGLAAPEQEVQHGADLVDAVGQRPADGRLGLDAGLAVDGGLGRMPGDLQLAGGRKAHRAVRPWAAADDRQRRTVEADFPRRGGLDGGGRPGGLGRPAARPAIGRSPSWA